MIKVDSLRAEYRAIFFERTYLVSALVSFLLFLGALFASSRAVQFATKDVGNSTSDILLDNLPLINTDIIFSEGALALVVLVTVLLLIKPRAITFTLKSLALLIYTRSLFVIMTHLAPYPDHIITDINRFQYISSGSDLFFSGHTAIPFMLALVFWNIKQLRFFFIFCSVLAANAVIFGHLHYTIDVFAAYFITYGVFHIAQHLFKADYHLFKKSLPPHEFSSEPVSPIKMMPYAIQANPGKPWKELIVISVLALWILYALSTSGFGLVKVDTTNTGTVIDTIQYACDEGKTITATYYKGENVSKPKPGEMPTPTGSVEVSIDGGTVTILNQTISGSGIRYANGDESLVFWSKGDEALIMHNNEMDVNYKNCLAKKRQ